MLRAFITQGHLAAAPSLTFCLMFLKIIDKQSNKYENAFYIIILLRMLISVFFRNILSFELGEKRNINIFWIAKKSHAWQTTFYKCNFVISKFSRWCFISIIQLTLEIINKSFPSKCFIHEWKPTGFYFQCSATGFKSAPFYIKSRKWILCVSLNALFQEMPRLSWVVMAAVPAAPLVLALTGLLAATQGADLSRVKGVQEITYQDGDTALLACDISNTNPGDRVSLLLWYKEDSSGGMGSPIYRIDARTNNHNIAIGETRETWRQTSGLSEAWNMRHVLTREIMKWELRSWKWEKGGSLRSGDEHTVL